MDLNKSELFLELLTFFENVNKFLSFDGNNVDDADEERKELYEKSNYFLKVFNLSTSQEVNRHEYLNMSMKQQSPRDSEEIYDYCAVESLEPDSKVCPYAKLKAIDLNTERPSIVGELIQLDRRSFFGKPKPVCAALIGRWLLIYLALSDQKPTQIVHVSKCEPTVDKLIVTVTNNKGKSVKFQLQSKQTFDEWSSVIEKNLQPSRERHSYVNVVDKRKLPTPPLSTFRPKSSKSDDIYEEPDLLNQIHDKSLYKNVDTVDTEEQAPPPALPEKRGKRTSIECEYDVPKNNRPTTPPTTSPKTSSPVKNSAEIRAKILQQGITLTPIETRPDPPSPKSPTKEYCRQTIKSWFRIKSKPKSDTDVGGGGGSSSISTSTTPTSTKMGRVNAIIQQLETSKHFLKKRHTIYDDSYEPMNHENQQQKQ